MRSDAPALGGSGQLRPLDQIFPLRGDASRGREMQATWRSFCRDRLEAVRGVLDAGRSPPEIAYQLGELLHNHFRTRGVTLTSYELRRLVAELLALRAPAEETADAPLESPRPPAAVKESEPANPPPVVAFEREPTAPWPGDVSPPPPKVPDKALEPPPSPIVTVTPKELGTPKEPAPPEAAPREVAPNEPAAKEAAPFEHLLTRAVDLAKGREGEPPRAAVDEAVAAVAREQGELPPATRERLAALALSEVAGLGLIDRLWSDRTVRAIFVNGPKSVAVERDGAVQPVDEVFRDEAHLVEVVTRLVGNAAGMADFRLRDGSTGFVIFPPAAPGGPVLTLRRAEPGLATLEALVAVGLLDRPIAELLRLCVCNRLKILVSGPSGSGKTALLAALIRDLDPGLRVVTVASHRDFRRPAPSKVELVAQASAPFATLIAAATRLDPGLLVLDGVPAHDAAALADRLRAPGGVVASVAPATMSLALAGAADVVVRTDRIEGQPRVVAVEDSAGVAAFAFEDGKLARGKPAFAATLQARGLGEAIAKWFG